MNAFRPARALFLSAALLSLSVLAACQTDSTSSIPAIPVHARQPLSRPMLALLEQKKMTKEDPILVRIFKEESELEVWKQTSDGQMALLKTYPICRWSGELGPKVREGDRQAPEGFYPISPAQMNPHSSFHLAFNLGYPNAFDTAHERTGSYLMVHGDCSSRGCYALTDAQIAEVYTLAREAFAGGQRAFQVQALPFRMTPKNMARHRGNPNMAFWRNLKEGYDHFEVARSTPRVDVCERRYVFNAQGEGAPPLDPAGRCPAFQVPEPLAQAVAAKGQSDDQQMAELVRAGIEVAPIRTNTDGGMHPVFVAKLKSQRQPGAAESADEVTTQSIRQGTVLREAR
jgi:murein L,D-transpeptidase YafK